MPKVSVIIPNYNHAPYLRQRIDSVLGQTYRDLEVILLDDASTDDSRSIVAEYAREPRVRIEFNEANSGSTFKQWAKGVRLAQGEYIWIAESDDYAEPQFLERLVHVLDEEPEVTFVYCRSWRITKDGQRDGFAERYMTGVDIRRWTADFRADGREECRDWFVFGNSVPNASCVAFRKAVYDRVGGVDENMITSGDWKLWVLMALEGKVAYISEPLNSYREHDVTVRATIGRTGRGAAEHLRMVRWMLERVTPSKAVVKMAYEYAAAMWVYPILNRRIPFRVRWEILKEGLRNDPHALWRLFRGMLIVMRLKTKKEWGSLRQRLAGGAS